jgi:hypothetical protein
MYSLNDFEKLVHIDNKTIINQRNEIKSLDLLNKILPQKVKTNAGDFFKSYKNRYVLTHISSYLFFWDKINLLFLNKFFRNNFKNMLNESHYKPLQVRVSNLVNSKILELDELLRNNADLLHGYSLIEENYMSSEKEMLSAYLIVGNILYKKYYYKTYDSSKEIINCNQNMNFVKFEFLKLNLGEKGFIYLMFILSRFSNIIQELNLYENNISGEALAYLKYAFKRPSTIKTLILEKNNLGDELGISFLVLNFPKILNLTFLNLCNINMSKDGALILAEKLPILQNLETLYLNENPIGSNSAGKILLGIKNINSLLIISMADMDLSDDFAIPFGKFILRRYHLLKFILSNNNFKENFISNLVPYFEDMKIKHLELDGSMFNKKSFVCLYENLMTNKNIVNLFVNDTYAQNPINAIKNYLQNKKISNIKLNIVRDSIKGFSKIE